jgi:hypothetical protein
MSSGIDYNWTQECLMVTSVEDPSTLVKNLEEAPANVVIYAVTSAPL